ncbi:MAG: sugar-binding protein, partial [Selenomonadaceae bacterium]|nr:sugar-binding protein [Selenomonadaceae bacterium]
MKLRRILAVLMSVLLLVLVAGCGGSDKKETKIGVAMPTQTRQRWNQDGANIEKKLLEQGYSVDLQYGNNEIDLQISQIEKMIQEGCKVIIIGAVDANSLSDVLEQAKRKNIKIISYDRLIMNTDAVDYYATFDNLAVGTMQGEYIEEKLNLKNGGGPFSMEITAGSLDDNNTISLFEGAMDVLRPYIQKGQLVVKSGQTDLRDCAISHWKEEIAKERMAGILAAFYGDGKLDAALCANDSTAIGVQAALLEAGYSPATGMPII